MSHYFDHSELVKALKTPQTTNNLWAKIKDRFVGCPFGMSFAVEEDATFTATQLRTLVSRRAKSSGKVFSVAKHGSEEGKVIYEVACIGLRKDESEEETKPNPVAETVGWQANANAGQTPWSNRE